MNGWAEGLQNAIQYIEDNLTEELDINDIAAKAYVSSFHFQRIFSALCGFTIGEYIRNRRLTLAGEELSHSSERVIDTAVKYGYDSQDSFTRAFTKFHGITPSAAREQGAELKAFAPLRIKLTLEGGTMMEYKIIEKSAFTIMGKAKMFSTWRHLMRRSPNGGRSIIRRVAERSSRECSALAWTVTEKALSILLQTCISPGMISPRAIQQGLSLQALGQYSPITESVPNHFRV